MTEIEQTLEAAHRAEARAAERVLLDVLPKINGLVATMARIGDAGSSAKLQQASVTLRVIAEDVASRTAFTSPSKTA